MCDGCQILSQQPRPDYKPGPGLPRQKALPRLQDLPNANNFICNDNAWQDVKGNAKSISKENLAKQKISKQNKPAASASRQPLEAARINFAEIWMPPQSNFKASIHDTDTSGEWNSPWGVPGRQLWKVQEIAITDALRRNASRYRDLKAKAHRAPCGIYDLPAELVLSIFRGLDICASVCFGLTCNDLLKIKEDLYPFSISLYMRTQPTKSISSKKCLGHLLTQWMSPKYEFDHSWGKFLLKKHYKSDPKEVERKWTARESWPRIRVVADKGGALIAFKSSTRGLR